MALQAGDTLLNGQYRITRLLGRGGFGFVYQATDTHLSEEVAIKELVPGLVGDERMLKRFLAEARMTMRLTHPHIVRTHHIFPEAGNYYIVMECMRGGSLAARLRPGQRVPPEAAVRIAVEVCQGLAYAHSQGVVHCDLKPANILFASRSPAGLGAAKVADFGIAHVSSEALTRTWMTSAGFVAGTLPYMSPEQADGVRDDPRIDVYALGAVVYRMLTGQPYLDFEERDTPGAVADNVYQIRNVSPAPPGSRAPGVPAWLDAVVLKALAKDPDQRYGSAEALRAALLEGAAASARSPAVAAGGAPGRPGPATPPPVRLAAAEPAPRALAPAPRAPARRWVPLLAAIVVLALVVVAAVVLLLAGGTGDGRPAGGSTQAAFATGLSSPALTPSSQTVPEATATLAEATPPEATARPSLTPLPSATPVPSATASPEPTVPTPTPTATPRPQVLVSAGSFVRGSTRSEIDAVVRDLCSAYGEGWCVDDLFEDELASSEVAKADIYYAESHQGSLSSFFIDRYEVTNAEYARCVASGACRAPQQTGPNPRHAYYADPARADHPAVYVTWEDARDFCRWAGGRLPTAAEWEKAARGSDGAWWPWGNGSPYDRANFRHPGTRPAEERQTSLRGNDLRPVGSFPGDTSPCGAMDMAGNVAEWVDAWYDRERRELRGGSWNMGSYYTRAANRAGAGAGKSFFDVGFRCARDTAP